MYTLRRKNKVADQNNEPEIDLSEVIKVRREKLAELKANGKDPFEIVKYDRDTKIIDILNKFDEYEGSTVSIAGRMMSKRVMGKAAFCDLRDRDAKVQFYVRIDSIGEEAYKEFKKYDIGDIIGVKGEVFKTHRGEMSVKATEVTLLSKSLQPLPEKWHGLKDVEIRYRQRYVDLIVNPEVRDTFIKRSQIIKEIRGYLDSKEFLEVETPVLHTIAGGAAARPFITHHNALDMDMYLRIALELHLKRLIVGGMDRVYEIGRVFRNEGIDIRHNPEFTLLELYQAFTDYEGMMDLTEDLIRTVALKILGTGKIVYNDTPLDLEKPFTRLSMKDAVLKYSGVNFDNISDADEAKKIAKEHNIEVEDHFLKGDVLNAFFEKYVEQQLVEPTFITGHPVEISPLAKRMPSNPDYTERFELFIMGREYANAFSELNDPIDQRSRFKRQMELRAAGDEEANDIDEDFILALEYGMPPTGGLGIGIDRLVMMLTNSYSIRDVLLFPTMKPILNKGE
ncbi:MAG: lysine--tRNA ligase [Bacillota bacterium]|nr:lysine--tRNA ligase [Bacillota bacterium]